MKMDWKKFKKVCSILLTVIFCVNFFNMAFATDSILGDYSQVSPDLGEGGDGIKPAVETVLGYIRFIGYAVAVGMILVIGIKYMMSASQERANLKRGSIYYIIGALIIAFATTIISIIMSIGNGSENAT